MADIDSERDRRVRELLSDQSKKKDQLAVMNQAQSEVGDIQSELRNHLAMEQAQDQARLQEAQTISQAAQGMMEMEGGDQLQGQVSAMNPQTQAALGKYGVKPGKTQNTSRNQASNRVVTKTGDTTNIKNENITNNHTEIRVTQPTIPMSQPTISVQPQRKEDNTSKFKAWLSGMFAKQQNEAEIQKKEYRKKEWNLGRTTSRLMKRIEDATSGLSSKLDPKNMTSTLGGQLKWLLLIFGATMMSKFWKPTMKFLANLEGGFRAVFGLPMNDDLRQASSGTLSVIDQIKDFIGIKKGENESLIGGIGKVFMEGIDKLIDKLKFWFEDRASALKDVEFPSIETPDFGPLGKIMAPIMEGLTDTFKGLTQYIGDLITVAMGGSKGKVKAAARKISRQAQGVFTDTTGKQTSAGDSGLVNGKGRNYMKDSDYDTFGNLKSNASSTQAMSRSLVSMFNDRSGKAHTAEIGTGVGQLFDVAKRNGQVVIDPELLGYLGLSQADIITLQRNKQLRQDRYRIIGVKPTTDAQRKEMGAYSGNGGFWTGGVAGTAAGAWAGAKLGAMAGGSIGSLIPGAGTAIGAGIGGTIGLIGGALAGGYTGSALGAAGDNVVKNWTTHGLYPKLVKADSNERGADGSLGVPKMMWVLTKEGADAVTAKFTHGMTNKDMDITNKEFYDKIRKIEERKKRQNGVRGALTQNLSTNDLQVAQSNYDAYNQAYNNKFVSNDPNSENMKNYGHWNTAIDNLTGMISSAGSWTANALRNGASFVTQERLGKSDQNKRAMYTMNRLVKEGLTPEQAAGVVANIMRESGFKVGGRYWDVNGPSGGIVGWHNENLKRVESYFGKDISKVPFEDQVDYLIKELKGEVNGIKALNRNGMASRYGFKSGANVWDVIKRTTTQTEAANVYERIFEGSQDYKKEGNRTRQEFANGYLKLYKQNPNLGDNYQSKPLPNISLSGLQEEDITSGGKIGVGWLGDSQSCVCGGLFPILVGQGLNTSFRMYARGSANATHYLGTGNTKHLSSPTTNIPGFSTSSTCKDALDWMLQNKPKYCFIELGHNGMSGYQNLVNKLRGVGIKVLCIKMWSTQAAPGTGMTSYSKEKIAEMYKGISADGMIDLTQIDVPKSKDGVHASKEGCAVAAREVIQQLSGAGVTKGEDQDSENFLKTHEGLFGEFSGTVAGALNWAADKMDSTVSNQLLQDPTAYMTKEQKAAVDKVVKYNMATEESNVKSWLSLGAKSDNKGVYFQNGDIRTYVRTDGEHSGLFGMKESDIDWIERVDQNGKTSKTQLTDDELEIAKKSSIRNVFSSITEYPDKTKGAGYNDFMTDEKGKPLGYNIGYFKDIQGFSETAQKDFGSGISFIIYPSKDIKRWTIVAIPGKIRCSEGSITEGIRYYGPIIYHKGAHWFKVGTDRSQKIYSDFQPVCQWHHVQLTPQANIEALKLLNFINTVGTITEKDGVLYTKDGRNLTQQEFQDAQKYGILTKVTGNRSANVSGGNVTNGYNYAVKTSEKLELNAKEASVNKYIESVGKTKKEREEYYKKNKSSFTTVNGILYDSQGVKWGTIDKKGNISFYDDETYKSTILKEGDEGRKHNLNEIEVKHDQDLAKTNNYVSRDTMAKFLTGVSNYTEKYKSKNVTVLKGIHGTRLYNAPGWFKDPVDVRYTAFINPDGSVRKYQVDENDLINALNKAGYNVGHDYFKNKEFPLISTNLNSLDELVYAKIAKSIGKKYDKDRAHSRKDNSNEVDKFQKDCIKKGKLIKEIKPHYDSNSSLDGYTAIFEDESSIFTGAFLPNKDLMMKQINDAISMQRNQQQQMAIDESFEKSGMEAEYKSYAEKANKGEMKYLQAMGNYVTTTGGDLFGYRDPKTGQIRALTGKEAYNTAFEYFNSEGNRKDFLSDVLGLKNINGKSYYQVKNGNTMVRTQIDTSKDLSNFMTSGIDNISVGAQKYENGKWVDITDKDEKENALKSLKAPVTQMMKNSGLTNKLIKALSGQFSSSANIAAKVRTKQLNTAVDQKTQQKRSNEYLKTLAEHAANDDGKLDELKKAIKDIDTNGNKEKVSNERLTKLVSNKLKGKNLDNYEVFSGNFANGNKVTFDITEAKAKKNKNLDANGDGILDENETKGAKTVSGFNEQGTPITIINSGGNYYVYTQNGYKRISDTGETMSSYASE